MVNRRKYQLFLFFSSTPATVSQRTEKPRETVIVTPWDHARRSLKCSIHHTLHTIPQTRSGTASESIPFFSTIVLTLVPFQFLVSNSPSHPIPLPIPTPRSFDTLVRRWPVILTTIIDHLYRVGHELATQPNDFSPAVAEQRIEAGKSVIEKISKLKYEMGREKPLLYVSINYLSPVPRLCQRFTWFWQANRRRW